MCSHVAENNPFINVIWNSTSNFESLHVKDVYTLLTAASTFDVNI